MGGRYGGNIREGRSASTWRPPRMPDEPKEKNMRPYTVASLLCLTFIFLAALAGAQTKDPKASTEPGYNTEASGRFNCETLAGKHWLMLTDPTTSPEDAAFHRQAAEAYEHLAAMGWPC